MVSLESNGQTLVLGINGQVFFSYKTDTKQLNVRILEKTLTIHPTICFLNGKPIEDADFSDGSVLVRIDGETALDVRFEQNEVRVGILKGKSLEPAEALVFESYAGSWYVATSHVYCIYDLLIATAK